MNRQDMEKFVNNISEHTNLHYEEVLDELGSRDLSQAILGFVDVEKQVRKTVDSIKKHPLISPLEIQVNGYVYDTKSGEIDKVC